MKIVLSVCLFATVAYAQENLSARDPRLNEGQLFAVKFVPGGKKVLVSLAGIPGAELGPDQILIFGRAIGKDGEARKISIRPADGSFAIDEPLKDSDQVEIEVREKRPGGKSETHILRKP